MYRGSESKRKKHQRKKDTMRKIEKGNPGYLDQIKKGEIIRTTVCFVIAAVLLCAGYDWAHTVLNLLSAAAVLVCIPAIMALLDVIAHSSWSSINQDKAKEIASKTDLLTACYDVLIGEGKQKTPVDCIVISVHNVFVYTHYEKADTEELSGQIRSILEQNGYTGIPVKVLDRYTPFLARVEGLNNIAAVEREDTKEREEEIRRIFLDMQKSER